jgi:hypothetical protein
MSVFRRDWRSCKLKPNPVGKNSVQLSMHRPTSATLGLLKRLHQFNPATRMPKRPDFRQITQQEE